jgi:hypothetical protein
MSSRRRKMPSRRMEKKTEREGESGRGHRETSKDVSEAEKRRLSTNMVYN